MLDEILPRYDRRELHRTRTTAAPEQVWRALHELPGGELRLMNALMTLRSLGRRRYDRDAVLDSFRQLGFRQLAEQPERELVLGGIGRFWTLDGGIRRFADAAEFTAFDEPGYAKVAFNFRLDGGELSTETRIAGTDARATRLFGLYWLAIRPGSGLIRREWLRAIARRAQSQPPTAATASSQSG